MKNAIPRKTKKITIQTTSTPQINYVFPRIKNLIFLTFK